MTGVLLGFGVVAVLTAVALAGAVAGPGDGPDDGAVQLGHPHLRVAGAREGVAQG